jgi:hypothetical protein
MVNHQVFQLYCFFLTEDVRPLTRTPRPDGQTLGHHIIVKRYGHPVTSGPPSLALHRLPRRYEQLTGLGAFEHQREPPGFGFRLS